LTGVSVVHIVACAVAQAKKRKLFTSKAQSAVPCVLIDECVQPTSDSVDVSVLENAGGW
jgi:hypothetical protein